MTYRTLHNRPSRQRGVATLLVALVIMVALTLLVFFSARTALQEERMAANEVRMKQTASAAQAGLERALDELKTGGATNPTAQYTGSGPDGSLYHVAFVDRDRLDGLPACPPDPTAFAVLADADNDGNPGQGAPDDLRRTGIWSCGWSNDRNARKGVATLSLGIPSVANPPTNPLTSRGGVDTNGNAEVYNAFNNLTIWTGSDLSIAGNPGNTYISDSPDEVTDPANWVHDEDDYLRTTDMNRQGPDVVDRDLQISEANLSGDDFFRNFMGQNPSQYRDTVPTILDPDVGDIDGAENEVIWFSQDTSFDGGQFGSRDNPVVIVVDGNLDMAGNVDIYGILYVREELDGAGTLNVFGSTIVEGDTSIGGTPSFIFDPVAAEGAGDLGARAGVAGAWRDWTPQ